MPTTMPALRALNMPISGKFSLLKGVTNVRAKYRKQPSDAREKFEKRLEHLSCACLA